MTTMTRSDSAEAADASPARDLLDAVRSYLGSRRGVLLLATIAVLAVIGLSWNWLATVGIAPILLPVLPCLVMCGLGLCMNRLIGNACTSDPAQSNAEPIQSETTANIVSFTNAPPGNPASGPITSNETISMKSQPLEQRRDTHA